MPKKTVLYQAVSPDGRVSKGVYKGDAGLDLTCSETVVIQPMTFTKVPCGVRVALPEGTAALIVGRSSTTSKGILVYPSLIEQYRGDLFVFCFSTNPIPVQFDSGVRIAQLVPIEALADNFELQKVDELPPSERGSNGFGSSGR